MALLSRPKPPTHHKKRSGKHHRTTKHYLKPYWPYIPLVAIASAGVLFGSLLSGSAAVLGATTSLSQSALLSATNNQRTKLHETSLNLNSQLNDAAQAKANDMVTRNYWSHSTPDGKQPWYFITASGYNYQLAGENLAYGFSSAAEVTTAWMNSPEHRANLLSTSYQDVGFGVANSPDFSGHGPAIVVVAMYGSAQPAGSVADIKFEVHNNVSSSNVLGTNSLPASQPVAFVQLFANSKAPWNLTVLTVVGVIAVLIFLIRHLHLWRKVIARGELFVMQHLWFDIFIVIVATASFVLTRTVGYIG